MENAVSGYMEKLGSNFIVASMIPSLALVVAVLTIFNPILHVDELFADQDGIYKIVGIGLLILIPTVISGFTLTALNTYILKFFEGYVFLRRFRFLKEKQRRRALRLATRIDTLEKRIRVLEKWPSRTDRLEKILLRLKTDHYNTTAHYDKNYPPEPGQVLPTQFGNILKAAEAYSGTRWGLDGVEFWPRLIQVIPPRYQEVIDGSRNQLSFLVNMCILGFIFFFLCLVAIFYNFITNTAPLTNNTFWAIMDESTRYFVAGLISLVCIFFFQRASIFSVGNFGFMIRSAYDLFRHDLLRQFHLKIPNDSVEEFMMWKNLGELIVLGQHNLNFEPLEYQKEDPKPWRTD